VTNQDGWLNALSLEKLTNTVCQYVLVFFLKTLIEVYFVGHESCLGQS